MDIFFFKFWWLAQVRLATKVWDLFLTNYLLIGHVFFCSWFILAVQNRLGYDLVLRCFFGVWPFDLWDFWWFGSDWSGKIAGPIAAINQGWGWIGSIGFDKITATLLVLMFPAGRRTFISCYSHRQWEADFPFWWFLRICTQQSTKPYLDDQSQLVQDFWTINSSYSYSCLSGVGASHFFWGFFMDWHFKSPLRLTRQLMWQG